MAGFSIGCMLATAISASLILSLVGSWRNVLFSYSGICIITCIMWWRLITETKPSQMSLEMDTTIVRASFRESITTVLRIRDIWLLTVASLGYGATFLALQGYLPVYMEGIGIAKNMCGTMVSTLYGGGILGSILIPIISDRIGARKIVLIIAAGIMCISTYLFSIVYIELAFWLLIPLIGLLAQGLFVMYLTLALEIREVSAIYGGTAAGIVTAGSDFGGIISSIIGGNLAEINQSRPFIFWAAMALLCLSASLIRESHKR